MEREVIVAVVLILLLVAVALATGWLVAGVFLRASSGPPDPTGPGSVHSRHPDRDGRVNRPR